MSPRPLVGPRLRRVLALVPYVLAHPGVPITELAERFEVSEAELERDLELLPLCGLPPYTADRLMDVWMVDGTVEIRLAEYFERPLRLTPAEGLALLAAGRALLSVPGSDPHGPLATALDKLDVVLDAGGRLAVHVGGSDHLEELQDAASASEQVEIDYYSFARDEMTTRIVDPWRVFHAFGAWYLAAWCHRANAERLFRVDRVRAVRPTGEHFEDPSSRAASRENGRWTPPSSSTTRGPSISGSRSGWRRRPTGWWRASPTKPPSSRRTARGGSCSRSARRPGWSASCSRSGPDVAVDAPPEASRVAPDAAARILAATAESPRAASGSGASERDDGGRGAAPVTDEVVGTSTEPLLGAPQPEGNGSASAGDGVDPSQPPNEKTVARGGKKGINRTVIEWVVLVVAAIIIAIVIKTFLFQAFYIPSRSMVPTLEVGDRVLVNKLSYDLHDVNRGDIVVFEAEPNADWRRAGHRRPREAHHRPAG